jgi:hypothetical protein
MRRMFALPPPNTAPANETPQDFARRANQPMDCMSSPGVIRSGDHIPE